MKSLIAGLAARHGLSFVGGLLVSRGLLSAEQVEQLRSLLDQALAGAITSPDMVAGALAAVGAIAWSAFGKWQAATKSDAPK